MLLSCRTTRVLFEALDRVGIPASRVLEPLGLERAPLIDPKGQVSWDTLVRIMAQISTVVDHDPGRLEAIGRAMIYVPAHTPLRWIARATVSPRTFYRLAERWVAPANFPHLGLRTSYRGDRVTFHAFVPDPYLSSEPFFHIVVGSFTELPVLMGFPPSTIVSLRVAPRSFDLVIDLPRSSSLKATARRIVSAVIGRRRGLDALEGQRRALSEAIDSLQRARDELRSLLERLPDMVVIHVDGVIVYVNRAFVRELGWSSADELVGRPLADVVATRSKESFRERLKRPIGDPSTSEAGEFELQTRRGTKILVEVGPTQEVVFDGKLGRLVVGRNLADRARLQQELAVADRLASLGLLAAGVAHEINNPLAYVLNNIEIALRQLPPGEKPAEGPRAALTVALEGVDRIRFIVRELLLLARGDDGAIGPTDVRSVVESTLALAALEIDRVATVACEFSDAPPALASIPRVAQIVLNLVLNAIEAMKTGPRERNVLVVSVGCTVDGRVRLAVADNGTGVSPDQMSRLFDPFYTTKRAGEGTGLGLAITQRLVVELQGEITFCSTLGRGTTFTVVLPAASDARRTDPRELPN